MGVRHFYAWIALVMAAFVGTSIIREFYKGARARSLGTGEGFLESIVNLTMRNTRRYGGYLAHLGFVLLFIGWSGQAFTADSEFEAGIGGTFQIRSFTVRVDGFEPVQGQNYSGDRVNVGLYKNGTKIANMFPGRRTYKGAEDEQAVSEIAIRESLLEDIYLVFQGPAPSDPSGQNGSISHLPESSGGVGLDRWRCAGAGDHRCAAAQPEIHTGQTQKRGIRRSRQRGDSHCKIPFVAKRSARLSWPECCFLFLRCRRRTPIGPKAVGSKLMCICGCQQVLTECNHIHCPSSVPMRAEVNEKLAAGMTDDQLLKSFVEKYGTAVLAAPAFSGLFNRTAWLTPFAALVIGLAGLIFYLRRIKSTTTSAHACARHH